jgi:hypothetical protein
MPDTLTKLAYQAFQDGKNYFGLGHKAIATQLRTWLRPNIKFELKSITPEFLDEVSRRRQVLLETDWQDAEAGFIPSPCCSITRGKIFSSIIRRSG